MAAQGPCIPPLLLGLRIRRNPRRHSAAALSSLDKAAVNLARLGSVMSFLMSNASKFRDRGCESATIIRSIPCFYRLAASSDHGQLCIMSKGWKATLKLPSSAFPYAQHSTPVRYSVLANTFLELDRICSCDDNIFSNAQMIYTSGRRPVARLRTLLSCMMALPTPTARFTAATPSTKFSRT